MVQDVEPALTIGERVELGGRASARAADRLALLSSCAPADERCVRTAVLPTVATVGGLLQAARAAKIRFHYPRLLQR